MKKELIIENIITLICFTILAVVFHCWLIVLVSAIFFNYQK